MAKQTNRINLYKPGGGLSGTNTPDEFANVDKLNENFDRIDETVGFQLCTSTTRPANPFPGQAILETDTGKAYIWSGSAWDIPKFGTDAAGVSDSGAYGRDLIRMATKAEAQTSLGIISHTVTRPSIFWNAGSNFQVTEQFVAKSGYIVSGWVQLKCIKAVTSSSRGNISNTTAFEIKTDSHRPHQAIGLQTAHNGKMHMGYVGNDGMGRVSATVWGNGIDLGETLDLSGTWVAKGLG